MAEFIHAPDTTKAVVQIVDNAYFMTNDGKRTLRLSWKAATSKIAGLIDEIYVGQALSAVNAVINTHFSDVDDAQMNIDWQLPEGKNWYASGSEVKQLEAGEYSVFTVLFEAEDGSVDPSEPFATVTEDSWQLQWQTYSVTPYRYCNERTHDDYLVDSDGQIDRSQSHSQASKCTIRRHIEMALTQNAQNSDNSPFQWSQENTTYNLTESEMAIANKIAAGVNPTFHYPIVVHTRTVETNLSSMPSELAPDVTAAVDIIAELPGAAGSWLDDALTPWTNLNGQWIYCGQNVSMSSRKVDVAMGEEQTIYTFQTQDTFEGALSADTNFYGPIGSPADTDPRGRWTFGVGPQLPPEDEED